MLKTKVKKMILIILMSSLAFGSLSTAAIAEFEINQYQEGGITPYFTCIVDAECDFSIVGTTATVDCWVNGDVLDATKAKVIAELQLESGEGNWIAYGTWVDTQNDYEAAVYETKEVKKGNTYRVKATYTVWEGSVSEDLVIFSDEVTA